MMLLQACQLAGLTALTELALTELALTELELTARTALTEPTEPTELALTELALTELELTALTALTELALTIRTGDHPAEPQRRAIWPVGHFASEIAIAPVPTTSFSPPVGSQSAVGFFFNISPWAARYWVHCRSFAAGDPPI